MWGRKTRTKGESGRNSPRRAYKPKTRPRLTIQENLKERTGELSRPNNPPGKVENKGKAFTLRSCRTAAYSPHGNQMTNQRSDNWELSDRVP